MVIEFTVSGITSLLQVYGLCTNNEFKYITKKLYLKWTDEFIKYEISKTPKNSNRPIKINIQVGEIMKITEEYVKAFNEGQCTSLSIKYIYIPTVKIHG